MTVQKQNAANVASGEKGDLMSLLLPALIEQYKMSQTVPATSNGGRRLSAEQVDFAKLQEIFASENFQATALEHLNDPSLHESLASNMD